MKNRPFYLPIISFLLILCLTSCAKKPSEDSQIIARVSNKSITIKDFNSKIAKMPAYYQNFVEKNKKRYLDEVIIEMLFYEEAIRRGIDKDKETRDVINEARKKIIIARLIKTEVEDKVALTEDEMAKYYEKHKDEFRTPEMWRASHILVASEKEAREIQDELARGASFEELARTRSTDATASRGGDVGFFRQGQVVPDFENACMKLDVGQTSDILRTQFGYHIIKLTDKRGSDIQSYEEAKRSIETELNRAKRSELFNRLVLTLKDKYGVKIKEDVFTLMVNADEASPEAEK